MRRRGRRGSGGRLEFARPGHWRTLTWQPAAATASRITPGQCLALPAAGPAPLSTTTQGGGLAGKAPGPGHGRPHANSSWRLTGRADALADRIFDDGTGGLGHGHTASGV